MKENVDMRLWDGTIDAFLRDTRHAVRRLARDWRFTAAAVLILGLGIGANSAISREASRWFGLWSGKSPCSSALARVRASP